MSYQDGAPTKYVTQPSASLKCPVCDDLFQNPVISTKCGHTFCLACVSENARDSPTHCPLDQTSFLSTDVVANRAVQGQLEDMEIFCRHGLIRFDSEEDFVIDENGCQEKIRLSQREEHESRCPFALLPCPNSSNHCGKFRRKDLDDHLALCEHTPCPSSDRGGIFLTVDSSIKELGTSEKTEWSEVAMYRITDFKIGTRRNNVGNGLGATSVVRTIRQLSDRVGDLEKDKTSLISQLEKSSSQISSLKTEVENLKQMIEQLRMTQLTMMRTRLGSQSTSDMVAMYDNSMPKSLSSSSVSASMSPPNSVSLWNAARQERWKMPFTFKCIGTFRGHTGTIWALTARGNNLFSAGADFNIKVWDVSDIKNSKGCIQTLKGHRNDVHALCTGNGCLYSAGSDQSIRVWSLSNFSLQMVKEDAHDNIICAILYTGKYLFSSSLASIKVWSIGKFELVHAINDLQHWVRALVCDQKREKIYSGSHNTVHIWDASSFTLRGKVDHNHGSVYSLAVTSRYLIVGTYNRNTHLYDINTFRPIKSLTGHLGTITGMTPSQSGEFLFTSSCDNTLQVWDIFKLLPIQVLSRHEASVNCVALRGNLLYSGSKDMEIKVYCYYQLSENTFIR